MRKFANLDRIQERAEAQKLGLSVEALRAKKAADAKRQADIDKAWAQKAEEDSRAFRNSFRREPKKDEPKPQNLRKANQAPAMRTTERKQEWNGTQWVKLEVKEPVNGN